MAAPSSHETIRGLVVLVVEDQFLLADLAHDILLEAGAREVVLAADVERALAALSVSPALDVAVIDIHLGGGSGFALADALRLRDIPFIFTSGDGSTRLPDGLRDAALLAKPYTSEMLIAAVAAAVGGARRPPA